MKASEVLQEKINAAISSLPITLYDANANENFEKNMKLIGTLRYEYERILELEKKYYNDTVAVKRECL